jgi:hypothetical protein
MKYSFWNAEKNEALRRERGVGLETIIPSRKATRMYLGDS